MLKNLIYLCLAAVTLIHPMAMHAADSEEKEKISKVKIKEMAYIADEKQPEMILTLDNEIRVLGSFKEGLFAPGQTVGLQKEEEALTLIKYDSEGLAEEQVSASRLGENSHFYKAD